MLDDIELIKKLPKARIHFTVTPFPDDVMRIIEPISPKTTRRWEVLRAIKDAGVRLHVNVSPVIPIISDEFVEEWAENLADIAPAEFFVDPFQAYSDSFESFELALSHTTMWPKIKEIVTTPKLYEQWKIGYRLSWERAWAKTGNTTTLPIWSDHVHRTWIDMRTGAAMDRQHYGDEA